MWVTLAAAGFFAIVLLITLVRAEKTVANGALTVITLLAIGIAVAATVRRFDPLATDAVLEARSSPPVASVAALSCLDGLAGEAVEGPCERALFASADVAAAAVSYTAAQISKLAPNDDPAAQTPEQQALRHTLERDRYGLVAQVLVARDHCSDTDCQTFRLFSDTSQISNNIRDHAYDVIINRYAVGWSGAGASPAVASVAPAMPTTPMPGAAAPAGRPTTIEFPSAASIPPVNIMTSEPTTAPAIPPPAAPKPVAAPAANAQAAPHPPAAVKKPAVANASAAVAKPRPITPPKATTAKPPPAPASAPPPAADADQ
jgi:hypothetical protein